MNLHKRTFLSIIAALSVFVLAVIVYVFISSNSENDKTFQLMSPGTTGIHFNNEVTHNNFINSYTYNNFYSGGGVALGDINNDGMLDIYLVANQDKNKLYLNQGNFRFKDITDEAGVGGTKPWSAGASMVDINGDGFLDIYVSNGGLFDTNNRKNEMFINNGDLTFTERAEDLRIDDSGYSVHASFFDYDKDGDLDLYLLNYTSRPITSFSEDIELRSTFDPEGGDKLYRNDLISDLTDSPNNQPPSEFDSEFTFTDVTSEAGIYSSAIGFGLGATIGDVDRDGWMDIYVSNDFFERDYLYMNNRDGTFRETLEQQLNSISTTSMSGDIGDLNNDGYPEIFIADMLPKKEERIKTLTDFIGWEQYQAEIESGFFRKFQRNTLQLNNGNGTFSEIGRYAEVEATDWSWGGLITDFNVDGLNDLFVANGVYKDMTNKDMLISFTRNRREFIQNGQINYDKLIESTPTNAIENYIFENQGDLKFIDRTSDWGLDDPSFSHGAAYGDLDQDGDLDLVVNNVNMESFIYRNRSSEMHPDRNWIQIKLKGTSPNTSAVGAQIELKADGRLWYAEQMLQRGFQSSVDPDIFIGLGTDVALIDTLQVIWPDESISVLENVEPRQNLTINQSNAEKRVINGSLPDSGGSGSLETEKSTYLSEITDEINLDWKHEESSFNDFLRSPMLYLMRSTEGPPLCTGDINSDGLEDFYAGGAAQQPGALFIQTRSGEFVKSDHSILETDQNAEDTDCHFFDSDGDGSLELYVASGSNEYPIGSENYADRIYKYGSDSSLLRLNDVLHEPEEGYQPTSVVQSTDIDGDGDLDLFVGVRMNATYGLPVGGYLLENDGGGQFTDQTERLAPGLMKENLLSAGITDAKFGDLNGDTYPDLVVVGEWMPVTIFMNNKNEYLNKSDVELTNLGQTNGWWQSLELADLDENGTLDIVAGNHGLNSRFRASPNQPVEMWTGDVDQNGTIEQIYTRYSEDGGPYPVPLLQNLILQVPYLRSAYPTFEGYSRSTVYDIFDQEQLDAAFHYKTEQMASIVAWNNGDGYFDVQSLPFSSQLAPMYGLLVENLIQDEKPEIIMGGNLSSIKPQAGPYLASYGTVLKVDSTQTYREVDPSVSGFLNQGEIRSVKKVQLVDKEIIVVAFNNGPLKIYEIVME